MAIQFITSKEAYYKSAVQIRIAAFFKDMPNTTCLINDDFESDGIHVVYLKNHTVLGTGRLNIVAKKAVISQMAVDPNSQKKGVGRNILNALIKKAIRFKINTIELEARQTAIDFYSKFNFIPAGTIYPSKKTGIIHQKMIWVL